MKAPAFDYCKPKTLSEALGELQALGDSAQVIAGGQSLMAMMNLRLSGAAKLVDITGLSELKGIERLGDHVRIGALVTHSELLASGIVASDLPLLHQSVPHVAHLAIRNRGTMGGSLSLADPAAEYPAVALACEAQMVLEGPKGQRTVAARDFFQGLYATARQSDELLVAVRWPRLLPNERVGFDELSRRRGDYAMVGVAARLALSAGVVQQAHLALFSVADTPLLATASSAALVGQRLDAAGIRLAQEALARDLPGKGDLQANPATKRHLAQVVLGRVLSRMGEGA
jgi:carbon-monoxide dehydrogenase medium subunit